MTQMFKVFFKSHPGVLLLRLALVYVILAVCRTVFYCYNREIIGTVSPEETGLLLKGALLFDSITVVYLYGLFIALSLMPLRAREGRVYRSILKWYYAVAGVVLVALNLSDAVYFHYTRIRLTASDVIFAGNDNSLWLVFTFIGENWPLLILFLLLSSVMVYVYKLLGDPVSRVGSPRAYYGINTVVLIAAAVVAVAVARGGGLGRTIRPVSLQNAMSYARTPAKAAMILSNPFCIIRTMGERAVHYKTYFTEPELSTIYSPYHYPAGDEGTLRGRNVVIFVLESFSAEHSALLRPDLHPMGDGFTPFLDSLMRDGLCFTSAYSNGLRSIEALPAILGSIPSFRKPFALMPQALGDSRQMPRILSDEGYGTMFFCGSPAGSMGFESYARQAGIEKTYNKGDYDAANPGNRDADGYWGVWDEPLLQYMGSVLGQVRQPFLSTVFTLSSHHPFVVPDQYADLLPEGTTRVHKPVAYTDMAVRRFFDSYGSQDWFANTLFVFTADHISSERVSADCEHTLGRQHIVTFFYAPGSGLRQRYEQVFQQIDIMPTVLGLMGYPHPYFAFGRDVFNEPGPDVMFGYNNGFYIADGELLVTYDDIADRVRAVYSYDDKLEQHNIYDPHDLQQEELTDRLRAVIQQYYTHVQQKNYLVPESACNIDDNR